MNIFKALSQGNGQISETNMTSFLSYLLNESDEFGSAFLLIFLESIKDIIPKYIEINGNSYREKINDLSLKYSYYASPEFRVQSGNRTQVIDINLTISDKAAENDVLFILIENKIKKSAIKKDQCLEQFQIFKASEEIPDNTPVYSVLITPPDEIFKQVFDSIACENDDSAWLHWTDGKSGKKSIEKMLKDLMYLENNLEISPINENTKYIIKSFVDHMSSELSEKNKQYSFSIAGATVVDSANFKKEDEHLTLKRFDNNMIRIFNIEDELLEIPVKPVLREIISKYKLDVDLFRAPGKKKNTQTLGKDVINQLNLLDE